MIYGNKFLPKEILSESVKENYYDYAVKYFIKRNEPDKAIYNLKKAITNKALSPEKCKALIQYAKPKMNEKQYKEIIDAFCKAYPSNTSGLNIKIKIEDENKFIKSILAPKVKQYVAEVNKDEKLKKEAKISMDKIEDKDERAPIRLRFDDSEVDDGYFILVDESQWARIAMGGMIEAVVNKLKKDKELSKYNISFDWGDGDEGCVYFKIN